MQFNRIGNKLGLAGAIGAFLAIGMIANQIVAEQAVDAANARANRSQQVVEDVLSANVNMRQTNLGGRSARLARNAAEADKAAADIKHFSEAMITDVDAALTNARAQ